MKRNVTRGVLAAAFAAAMGFGAAQAVAAPVEAALAACNQDVCTQKCAQDGLVGICSGRGCYCR